MAINTVASLTRYVNGQTIVTARALNSLYGGLYGTSEALGLDATDPLVAGHSHDGLHQDGHAQKINLSDHVTGKLPGSFIDDEAIQENHIFRTDVQSEAIPEYIQDDNGTHYLLDLSLLRAEVDSKLSSSKNIAMWLDIPNNYAIVVTGLGLPLFINDIDLVGRLPNGAVDGDGNLGVVTYSFPSQSDEQGTGPNQAALGQNNPYPQAYYPGQFGIKVRLTTKDGADIVAEQIKSGLPTVDCLSKVYGYLSYRSDVPANFKWRVWLYYKTSAGVETFIDPTSGLSDIKIKVVEVVETDNLPVMFALDTNLVGSTSPVIPTGGIKRDHIAAQSLIPSKMDNAYVDGIVTNASLRTLGTGAQQAAAGNHSHAAEVSYARSLMLMGA